MFEAKELRNIIEAGSQQLKAMILLGVNCGFGNTDVSSLPKTAIDLNGGWTELRQNKNGSRTSMPVVAGDR
jgi:hypothetical protein